MKGKRVRIRRKKTTRRKKSASLMPRRKKDRRKVEFLGAAALAIFMVLSASIFGAASLQRYAMRSPEVAAVVSAVLVQLANHDRSQRGLDNLTVSPTLVAAAQAKANDMATHGYFAHVSPTGVDPWHWFKLAGYSFTYAGENLAVNFSDSGDVNTAWMNSPTHRANILDPHYTQIGIATAQGMYQGHLTTFVVQEFGAPATKATQAPVATSNVPSEPTKIATASTQPAQQAPSPAPTPAENAGAKVLGTSVDAAPAPSAPHSVATTAPALAAALAQKQGDAVPWWGYVFGFPREAVHLAFYLLAGLILAALALDTGLEMHWHHRRKALHALTALAVVCICFMLADYLFFAPPVLALLSATAI